MNNFDFNQSIKEKIGMSANPGFVPSPGYGTQGKPDVSSLAAASHAIMY